VILIPVNNWVNFFYEFPCPSAFLGSHGLVLAGS